MLKSRPGSAHHQGAGGSPLVGRKQELLLLSELLESAGRGEGQVVFIGGEPGIGKSRVLSEFAARARAAGWLPLAGRAYEMEGMPPYLPFIEMLRQHLQRVSDEDLTLLASGAPELCLLLPEVGSRIASVPVAPGVGPENDRYRLFEAVSTFLGNVARQTETKGLVLLLDDLHWADRSTLLLLQHVARRLTGTPMLIAAAYRTTDAPAGHPLQNVLADLTRDRLCQQITLPPLEPADASMLIKNLAGVPPAPSLAAEIHHETGGNPFFLEELVHHFLEIGADFSLPASVDATIPETVHQVLEQRVGSLGAETKKVLQAASALGDTFSLELVSAVAEIDILQLTGAAEEAEQAGMIREEGQGYAFRHALIRRAIYDAMSLPRRRLIHLRAADAMERSTNNVIDPGPAAVGHHWRLSGHPERAIDYLLRAGDVAIPLTAWDDTIRHWEGALECMEETGEPAERQARLLEGLGDLDFLISFEAYPSVDRYLRASALYEAAGDLVAAARTRSRAGRSLAYPTSSFDYPAALGHLRAAEEVLSNGPETVELGELYAALAHAESHALRSTPTEMVRAMRRLREIAEHQEQEFLREFLRIQSYHLEGHYLGLQGRLAEGLALEEQACTAARALRGNNSGIIDNFLTRWREQTEAVAANRWSERWQDYLRAYSSAGVTRLGNDAGSFQFFRSHTPAFVTNFTAHCCGFQSLELLDPARARLKHELIRDSQGHFLSPFLVADLFLSGDIAAIRQLADAGGPNPEQTLSAQTLLRWTEGSWAQARDVYEQRALGWQKVGSNTSLIWMNRLLLRFSRAMGDLASAEMVARETLSISLRSGAVKYEFHAHAELGLLAAETSRLDEAEAHLQRCREILAEGEDWRGLGGRAELAEAAFAAAVGQRAEADRHFTRSIEIFQALGLPWDEAEAFELWACMCCRSYRTRSRQSFVVGKLDAAAAIYQRIGAGQPWLERLDAMKRNLAGVNAGDVVPNLAPDGLSEREIEVLRLIVDGRSNREIGDELVIAPNTVARHVSNIFDKIGAANRAEAAAYALRHHITE